ncbi:hypothetical protein [Bacillus sp. V5-8f]|uniref:hypothetical protein n=1 Tax=Bacillus sp. V5-8f TaxID=2053044 RepID=UPI000C764E6F|nr:hypothetical protein [Bacillus sp. V5-8f]PLT33199.1 hypothetical protein CUU64_15600 [Bacillus sp. V5-8f]
MLRKFNVFALPFIMIFIMVACNDHEFNGMSPAEYWNSLDRNQKHILVTTELEKLRGSGLTIIVEEYYFIDKLDEYYNENPSGKLPVHEAVRKIGNSTGTIQAGQK